MYLWRLWDRRRLPKTFGKKLLLSKAKDWKYEKEVRMIVPLNSGGQVHGLRDDRYMTYPREALTGVIFGCLMPAKDQETIRRILTAGPGTEPRYYKAEPLTTTYKLEITPVVSG